jgi:hypothetical protein
MILTITNTKKTMVIAESDDLKLNDLNDIIQKRIAQNTPPDLPSPKSGPPPPKYVPTPPTSKGVLSLSDTKEKKSSKQILVATSSSSPARSPNKTQPRSNSTIVDKTKRAYSTSLNKKNKNTQNSF